MNIKHHLDEATLVSYAAGSLSQSMALVVACHLSMCSTCRDSVNGIEAIGGMLLNSLDPADINADSLNKVLACLYEEPCVSIDSEPFINLSSRKKTIKTNDNYVPSPLRDYVGESLNSIDWKFIVPGIYSYDLACKTERGGVSRLLRIAPGKAMLPHRHDGSELTLILRGSYSDEIGRFTLGDVADLDSEIEHQPLVDSNEDCICLIATDAPLKFKTLLGKIVQPITGF
jgi:putative transcriptional regulator